MRDAAKVLTSHVFDHMGVSKANLNILNLVKTNVAVKIGELYQLDPMKRIRIIAKLDDVKDHSHLDSQSFMALLHERLNEIKAELSTEKTEIESINTTVDELMHFLDYNIEGRIL